jgi:hypothetical protein
MGGFWVFSFTQRLSSKIKTFAEAPLQSQHWASSFLKRFGKSLAVIVSVIVIVILALSFFIPPGAATIPLNVSYTVGEKMVYNIKETESNMGNASFPSALNPIKLNSTETENVIGFNGETYTINTTQSFGPLSISYIEQVNSTGYTEDIYPQPLSNEAYNISNVNPVLVFLAMPSVHVGETKVISLDNNSSDSSTTGNMTLTFVDIQSITVPAGAYKVFRVDSSSNMVTNATLMPVSSAHPAEAPSVSKPIWLRMSLSANETSYVEYDTGHLIECNVDIVQPLFSNESINVKVNTQLTEDIIPSQTLPSQTLAPSPTSPQQQESMSFLQGVSGLDMQHYTVQSQGALAAGFYKCTLTSSDNSLDLLFNFNNSHVTWCQLYPSQGTPDFVTPSTNMLAATTFLINYYGYSQAPYIPTLQSMLDNVTGDASTTVTQGTISLNVSVSGNTTSLVWTNTQTPSQTLILDMQNGGFSFFNDAWT